MALLSLVDVRATAAAALAPVTDADPDVQTDVTDAVSPPTVVLEWWDPWLDEHAIRGYQDAQLAVLCIAARLEPGPGVAKLEELVAYVIRRMRADTYSWPQATTQAPRVIVIGGVNYLAARVVYRLPVAVE